MSRAVSVEAIDVVILCGGKGTRLGELTRTTPKPLLPVGDHPFLLHRLAALQREGFSRFILAVHYLAPQFRTFVERYADRLPDVTIVEEPRPLGTGGALRYAAQQVRSSVFVALNGDSWGLQAAAPVVAAHRDNHHLMTMVIVRAERVEGGARAKGMVSLGPNGVLLGFSTGDASSEQWVNTGLYVLDRELVRRWPDGAYSFEERVMSLIPSGQGAAFYSDATLLDIGTPECYARATRELAPFATSNAHIE